MLIDPNAPPATMFDSILAALSPALTNATSTIIDAVGANTAAGINPTQTQLNLAGMFGQGNVASKTIDPTLLLLVAGAFLVLHHA